MRLSKTQSPRWKRLVIWLGSKPSKPRVYKKKMPSCGKIFFFKKFSPNVWMGGFAPGCPLCVRVPACCVTPHAHHPPARARFTGDNFDRKFNVPQVDGDTVPPGPGRSSFASGQLAEWRDAGQTALLSSFEPAATGLRDRYHSPRPLRDKQR